MIDRIEIIESAIFELGINFVSATFTTTRMFEIANKMFDQIAVDSMANLKFNLTTSISTLNKDFSDTISFDGKVYHPYQMPRDLLWVQSVSSPDFKIVRDILYSTDASKTDMIYCSKTDVQNLDFTVRQYLIFSLALKLANPLHRSTYTNEIFTKQKIEYDKIMDGQIVDRNSIWDEQDKEGYGIY